MKRAFSLIELLVVISIMAVMGTVAVGGYRAMQRGMDERGTMENVNAFVRLAYQRAQIDRQPTVVYFWNETLQRESDSNNTLRVVGKAVAVRRGGRLTDVKGLYLIDEFADLNFSYDSTENKGAVDGGTMSLYLMDDLNNLKNKSGSSIPRSLVYTTVLEYTGLNPSYLSGAGGALPTQDNCNFPGWEPYDMTNKGHGDNIIGTTPDDNGPTPYAFVLADEDDNIVTWQRGMAYGFEFARIQLPVGFLFGNDYSTSTANPIRYAGAFVFKPGLNRGSGVTGGTVGGSATIAVYELLPDSSGNLAPKRVDTSEDPSK